MYNNSNKQNKKFKLSRYQTLGITAGIVFLGSGGVLAFNEDARHAVEDAFDPKGSLVVTATGGSVAVTLDNKDYGSTPVEVARVKTGERAITLTKEGYKPLTQYVEIEERKTTTVNISFDEAGNAVFEQKGKGYEVVLEKDSAIENSSSGVIEGSGYRFRYDNQEITIGQESVNVFDLEPSSNEASDLITLNINDTEGQILVIKNSPGIGDMCVSYQRNEEDSTPAEFMGTDISLSNYSLVPIDNSSGECEYKSVSRFYTERQGDSTFSFDLYSKYEIGNNEFLTEQSLLKDIIASFEMMDGQGEDNHRETKNQVIEQMNLSVGLPEGWEAKYYNQSESTNSGLEISNGEYYINIRKSPVFTGGGVGYDLGWLPSEEYGSKNLALFNTNRYVRKNIYTSKNLLAEKGATDVFKNIPESTKVFGGSVFFTEGDNQDMPGVTVDLDGNMVKPDFAIEYSMSPHNKFVSADTEYTFIDIESTEHKKTISQMDSIVQSLRLLDSESELKDPQNGTIKGILSLESEAESVAGMYYFMNIKTEEGAEQIGFTNYFSDLKSLDNKCVEINYTTGISTRASPEMKFATEGSYKESTGCTDWKTFKNDELGVQFEYPPSWEDFSKVYYADGGISGERFIAESGEGYIDESNSMTVGQNFKALAGGTTKDFAEGRGGGPLDFAGFDTSGSSEKAICNTNPYQETDFESMGGGYIHSECIESKDGVFVRFIDATHAPDMPSAPNPFSLGFNINHQKFKGFAISIMDKNLQTASDIAIQTVKEIARSVEVE